MAIKYNPDEGLPPKEIKQRWIAEYTEAKRREGIEVSLNQAEDAFRKFFHSTHPEWFHD